MRKFVNAFRSSDVVARNITHPTLDNDPIAHLSQVGFAIFPLNGKRPLKGATKWENTPVDKNLTTEKFKKLYPTNNYGVVVGEDHLIIDIDVKRGDGIQTFRKLTQELGFKHGWESDTFVVKSGTGGFHIYLSKTLTTKTRKNLREYPDIDFLSGNMYVVGPGSVHPDTGVPYSVVFGSPRKLASAPTALISYLKPSEMIHTGIADDFKDDDPLNIERYIELLAAMPQTTPGGQRNACYIAACRGRDLGLTFTVCAETITGHYNGVKLVPAIRLDEVMEITRNAYRYGKNKPGATNPGAIFHTIDTTQEDPKSLSFDTNKDGTPSKTLNNAVTYLSQLPALKDVFRYNEFSGNIEIDSRVPWYKQRQGKTVNVIDEDVILLKYYLAREVSIEFTTNLLWEAIIVCAHKKHYHPVQNYINSLKWDGVSRVDTWLSYYCNAVDTEYTRAIGRKVLCAAVRRVFHPGCKWDYVLILEGAQGIGKSTVCRVLGRLWSGDVMIDPHSKDTVSAMAGKWVIELSEMASLKWAESNALKAFISRDKDVVRLPYKRSSQDFLRQSIFIGTVNPDTAGYLSDFSGNRRYWIAACHAPFKFIDLENDCDQLWAEAFQLYQKETLFLEGKIAEAQTQEAIQRMPDNFASKHICQWLEEHPEDQTVILQDLLLYCGMNPTRTFKGDISKVTEAMASAGWFRERVRKSGVYITVFNRPGGTE